MRHEAMPERVGRGCLRQTEDRAARGAVMSAKLPRGNAITEASERIVAGLS